MTKEIIIILLLIALFYLYQQNKKNKRTAILSGDPNYQQEISETISDLKIDKEILEGALDDIKAEKAELQTKLTNKETELHLILDKWNWGKWKPKNATEFINKFEPWIDKNLEVEKELSTKQKEIKEFLKDVQADSLEAVSHQLTNLEKDKESLQRKVEQLKENREESEELVNLELERDELKRDKYSLEQDNIAINNRLINKVSELTEKEKELVQIKENFNQKDKALNDKISEWKKKYNDKVKLLDEEQLESKRLEEENEKLQEQVQVLTNRPKSPMPGEWEEPKGGGEWERELKERHQLELTQIAKALSEELPVEITGETVLELAKKSGTQPPIFSKQRKKDKK